MSTPADTKCYLGRSAGGLHTERLDASGADAPDAIFKRLMNTQIAVHTDVCS